MSLTPIQFRLAVFINTNTSPTVTYGNKLNGPPFQVTKLPDNSPIYEALGYKGATVFPAVYRACGYTWMYAPVVPPPAVTVYDFWRSPTLKLNPNLFVATNLYIDVWDVNPDLNYTNPSLSGSVLEAMGVLISNGSPFLNYQWYGVGDNRTLTPKASTSPECLISSNTDGVSLQPPAPETLIAPSLSYGGGFPTQACYTYQPAIGLTIQNPLPSGIKQVSIATFLKFTYTPTGGSPQTMLFINDPEMILDTSVVS